MGRRFTKAGYKQQKSAKLSAYKKDLGDMDQRLIFCVGLPSTGKTRCAVEIGLQQVIEGKYEKLVVVRPVILPECGLLKGTLLEKMAPYTRQVNVYCESYNGRNIEDLERTGQIEIIPADLLQGDRFQNCFVIMDEFQNTHKEKSFAILSRIGENSKFVIIGDTSRGQKNKKIPLGDTLIDYCIKKFEEKDFCSIHSFYEKEDILGDDITKEIILTLIDDFV